MTKMVKAKTQKNWGLWGGLAIIVVVASLILLYSHSVHFNIDYLFWNPTHVENFDDHEQEFLMIMEEIERSESEWEL